jgi:hypothetical protein
MPTEEVSDIKSFVTSFEDIKVDVGLGHGWHMRVLYSEYR